MRRAANAARAAGLTALLIAVSSGVALADKGGAGTETMTAHEHEAVIFSMPAKNPCTGQAGMLTAVAANAMEHETTQADGNRWATFNAEGTATFTPSKGGLVYSGHFHAWFGESRNNRNEVEHGTETFVLSASNGSQVIIHTVSHFGTNAAGGVAAEFEVTEVQCG
jgi:hypothetical protein